MSKDRKLTAIMFLDMVGYTAMMQESEEKTQIAIQHQRDIVMPIVARWAQNPKIVGSSKGIPTEKSYPRY